MAAWYFLISVLAFPSCLVAGQSSTFGLKGENGFLRPNIARYPDGILWKCKGNKVVEFDGQQQQVFGTYENRITLNWVTAELNIAHLRLEDSGDYELEVEFNNMLHTSYHALEVMDKVSKPSISCQLKDGGGRNMSGELVCSAEPQASLKFEWRARAKLHLGPRLQVPLGDERDDEVYSCSVSNRLSKETTAFTAKDCHPAYFAEDDLEKQSPPRSKEDSNKREAQNDEKRNLVRRESTLASDQKLHQGNRYRSTNTATDGQNEATDSHHEGDADVIQPKEPPQEKDPLINPSDCEEEKDPEPAGVRNPVTEDKESSPEQPQSPERPEPEGTKQQETPNEGKEDHQEAASPQSTGFPSPQNERNLSCIHKGDADVIQPILHQGNRYRSTKTATDKQNEATDSHHEEPEDGIPKEGDADVIQPKEPPQEKDPLINPSDCEEEKDPEPAGVRNPVTEDKESSPEQPQSPERPEPEGTKQQETPNEEPEKEAEPQSAPHVDSSQAARSCPPLNLTPKNPAGEEKDVANSGQVTGESAQKKVGASDSLEPEGESNESDNCGGDKPMSTDAEQRGSRASIEPEGEGEDEDRSQTDAGDHEGTANSRQPQSPRRPDQSNTDAGRESSDASRARPGEEEETGHGGAVR
ncbi:uncharacterized protein AB9W97_020411 isoform 2-T2 [Spinachia spinachia]